MSERVERRAPDVWPEERTGYDTAVPVAYAPVPAGVIPKSKFFPLWLEEKIAAGIAVAGLLWSVQALTSPISRLTNLLATPGPLEVCGISILVWLHTKWRRSIGV